MKNHNLKPHTLVLTNSLVHNAKRARGRYQEHLKKQKKESKENEKAIQLKLLNADIKEIEQRKRKLKEFFVSMENEFVELATKAEKEKNLDLLSKGTALLSKANEKRKELSALESDIA